MFHPESASRHGCLCLLVWRLQSSWPTSTQLVPHEILDEAPKSNAAHCILHTHTRLGVQMRCRALSSLHAVARVTPLALRPRVARLSTALQNELVQQPLQAGLLRHVEALIAKHDDLNERMVTEGYTTDRAKQLARLAPVVDAHAELQEATLSVSCSSACPLRQTLLPTGNGEGSFRHPLDCSAACALVASPSGA